MNEDKQLEMSAPWEILHEKIKALFEQDSDIIVLSDGSSKTITIIVDEHAKDKQIAIMSIMPRYKVFGNVTVKIVVRSSDEPDMHDILDRAFMDNPAVEDVVTLIRPFGDCTFVVFEPKVVQYYTDDLGTPDGFTSTLYQDIAADIFDLDGVGFCTGRVAENGNKD